MKNIFPSSESGFPTGFNTALPPGPGFNSVCLGRHDPAPLSGLYQTGSQAFPMTFPELSSYIWLQQALLALYMSWYFDNEIFDSIISGNVSYELCRPMDTYTMWFIKTCPFDFQGRFCAACRF